MLVISDTSPVRALHAVGRLELLRLLFHEVIVPPSVVWELQHPPTGSLPVRIEEHDFLRVVVPSSLESIDADLDAGEREAISLARELRADWLLIDERIGHGVAARLGIPSIGVLGVILEAKRVGFLDAVRPVVDHLRQNRFFISDPLYELILRQSGE